MTDHNAEGGKKVEPCNLCGKAVTYTLAMSDYVGGDVRTNCDCFAITCDEGLFLPDDWNAMQRRILEQRRKDFNAGYAFANHMERCSGEPDFKWSYAPKFYNYSDDGRPEEIDAFDLYLEKDRK